MPETKNNSEAKALLDNILNRAYGIDEDTPFEDLLEQLEGVKYCREVALEVAGQRVARLLNSSANTNFQTQ